MGRRKRRADAGVFAPAERAPSKAMRAFFCTGKRQTEPAPSCTRSRSRAQPSKAMPLFPRTKPSLRSPPSARAISDTSPAVKDSDSNARLSLSPRASAVPTSAPHSELELSRRWQHGSSSSVAQLGLPLDRDAQPSCLPGSAEKPADESYWRTLAAIMFLNSGHPSPRFRGTCNFQKCRNPCKGAKNHTGTAHDCLKHACRPKKPPSSLP